MRLLFKQRMFSWFDSYDIYNEDGSTAYEVKGQLSWGHKMVIFDPYGRQVGMVQQRVLTLLPKFEIYDDRGMIGSISREFSFLVPRYNIDFNGWHVEGSMLEWDYRITDARGYNVATISKELWNWTDTYVIDVARSEDALYALMFVLAIDAEKCSRD